MMLSTEKVKHPTTGRRTGCAPFNKEYEQHRYEFLVGRDGVEIAQQFLKRLITSYMAAIKRRAGRRPDITTRHGYLESIVSARYILRKDRTEQA